MVQHTFTEDIQAILAALVGGARYGFKIRVPHALVMTALFRSDLTAPQKVRYVVRLALEHATNLAMFATIYKASLAILKRASRYLIIHASDKKTLGRTLLTMIVDGPTHHLPPSLAPPGEPDRYYHAFLSGWLGGYFVWGRYSSVNHQIVLYLASRVLVGLAKRGWERIHGKPHHDPESLLQHPRTYPLLAALVWGMTMVLFEESPHVLHRSLKASMDEIYRYQLSNVSSSSDVSFPSEKV
eukprot:Nitzschia sp. Nitz4//scaffold39_size137210//119085//119947//NITZ4_003220-RA/size137210-augustus-gene-0.187-mRNA-1//1//CDS//3329550446//68//frame0